MNQRIPSVPLITCDPYFSLWSPYDKLTDGPTCHWTGAPKPMDGAVRLDGKSYRFLGGGDAPALPQTGLEISPTATRVQFLAGGVELTVTFLTPLLLSDLELMSRPVSYVSFSARALDGDEHALELSLTLDGSLCYDGQDAPPLAGGVHRREGFDAAWLGQRRQAPLSHSGDGVTADWGYLYLALSTASGAVSCTSEEEPRLTASLSARVSAAPWEQAVCVGYDDLSSIQYFGETLRGYWTRDGQTILDVLEDALQQSPFVFQRCARFDESLRTAALELGGEEYALLCALGYRQSIAAHKLVADRQGELLFLSKECFSNGCAATADVSYPSAPLYLLYRPELVEAMLRPIFRFAHCPSWTFDFAPHDAGRYPYVWGQVYGLNKYKVGPKEVFPPFYQFPADPELYRLDRQMPVEECGNVLLLAAAAALAKGTAESFREELSLLGRWADYLLKFGADPGDQLCTDDFAGHLAHNVNLAAKAILGVEAYSILLGLLDRESEAAEYHEKAADMARVWEARADCGGHTALTFGGEDTWSLKYNLVWDLLFGSRLFSKELYERETRWYLQNQNDYGVPLDSRRDYTKSDWILWVAGWAENGEDFKAYLKPLVRYLRETEDRVPFSDWFDTKTARQQGFQNRTVQGGLFLPLLLRRGLEKPERQGL